MKFLGSCIINSLIAWKLLQNRDKVALGDGYCMDDITLLECTDTEGAEFLWKLRPDGKGFSFKGVVSGNKESWYCCSQVAFVVLPYQVEKRHKYIIHIIATKKHKGRRYFYQKYLMYEGHTKLLKDALFILYNRYINSGKVKKSIFIGKDGAQHLLCRCSDKYRKDKYRKFKPKNISNHFQCQFYKKKNSTMSIYHFRKKLHNEYIEFKNSSSSSEINKLMRTLFETKDNGKIKIFPENNCVNCGGDCQKCENQFLPFKIYQTNSKKSLGVKCPGENKFFQKKEADLIEHKNRCKKCSGTGTLVCSKCQRAGVLIKGKCPECGGSGKTGFIFTSQCRRCKGRGRIAETCSKCGGVGKFDCSECGGVGIKICGLCEGQGIIMLPNCYGNQENCKKNVNQCEFFNACKYVDYFRIKADQLINLGIEKKLLMACLVAYSDREFHKDQKFLLKDNGLKKKQLDKIEECLLDTDPKRIIRFLSSYEPTKNDLKLWIDIAFSNGFLKLSELEILTEITSVERIEKSITSHPNPPDKIPLKNVYDLSRKELDIARESGKVMDTLPIYIETMACDVEMKKYIEEIMRFIIKIYPKYGPDSKGAEILEKNFQRLIMVLETGYKRIALMGEFSTGKTYMLNHLLSLDLPVDDDEETSVPYLLTLDKKGRKYWFCNKLDRVPIPNLEHLKLIEKENEELEYFQIGHSEKQYANLMFIDLPGGKGRDKKRRSNLKKIVEDPCCFDAAIYVTTEAFLKGNLNAEMKEGIQQFTPEKMKEFIGRLGENIFHFVNVRDDLMIDEDIEKKHIQLKERANEGKGPANFCICNVKVMIDKDDDPEMLNKYEDEFIKFKDWLESVQAQDLFELRKPQLLEILEDLNKHMTDEVAKYPSVLDIAEHLSIKESE